MKNLEKGEGCNSIRATPSIRYILSPGKTEILIVVHGEKVVDVEQPTLGRYSITTTD